MSESPIEISLFPIPESVALPFRAIPLHIFEPRYRKMVKDSVEQKRRIGIAHTLRELAPARVPLGASNAQILSSNLESYEAHSIFSAGFATVLETLEDGRLVVEIDMDSRYQTLETVQEIPYQIVRCVPYHDFESIPETANKLRIQLDDLLMNLQVPGRELLMEYLLSKSWKEQSTLHYSFAIYRLVQMEADFLQKVLEMRSPEERIKFLKQIFEK